MLKRFYLILAFVCLSAQSAFAFPPSMQEEHHPMFRGMHAKNPTISHHPSSNIEEVPAFIAFIPVEETIQFSDIRHSDDPFDKIKKKYRKILRKIARSHLSQEVRTLLSDQAKENKDLTIKQAQEKMRLCIKHSYELSLYRCVFQDDEETRQLLKKIRKL